MGLNLPFSANTPTGDQLHGWRNIIYYMAEELRAGQRDPLLLYRLMQEMMAQNMKEPARDYPVRGNVEIF